MRPEILLDAAILAGNARAWETFAGVPVYAVVKGDGYGWGYRALVGALEGHVAGFCVADEEELRALRRYSAARAIVLANVPVERLEDVLDADALPTIGSELELSAAQAWARRTGRSFRVRVGLRPAAAWSGLSFEELRDFAPLLARSGVQVELWSHVTDWDRRAAQLQHFQKAARTLRNAGVRVVETDFASTFPLAADGPNGSKVRVGVGLFGATGGRRIPGVHCALRVVAPVTRRQRLSAATPIGYGAVLGKTDTTIVTARCGYADGLPRTIVDFDGILSVGMQYVTTTDSRLGPTDSHDLRAADSHGLGMDDSYVVLLDAVSDLDAFATSARRLPHEIVTAFGNAALAHARP